MNKKIFLILILLVTYVSHGQSDILNVLKAGEVVLSGLSIFKDVKADVKKDSKVVASVCIKNKLSEKILFKLTSRDEKNSEIKKELIIQNDGKECVFDILKGVYAYEILLSNNEIYKKGEYRFDDNVVMTIKKTD